MSAWYNKFHHTEQYDTGKKVDKNGKPARIIFFGLAKKNVYYPNEMRPGDRKVKKGERQMRSRNNKHRYILFGRYV